MVAMGRGGGKTPVRVVSKINDEVKRIGQNATARAIGLPLYSIHKYLKGIAEPSQATLEKLAAYFAVSVAWLRGDTVDIGNTEIIIACAKCESELQRDIKGKSTVRINDYSGQYERIIYVHLCPKCSPVDISPEGKQKQPE